ncbi:MAG TPA: hypothetical protein VGT61_12960 [Thermomicrobiales bacterium]|jgi:hypothetical protein|nr:hypothetical protein [Thermomicrobiales bacterium]
MPIAVRLLASLIALLIVLGGIAVAMTWGLTRVGTSGSAHQSWEQSLDGATRLSAQVRVDTGRVELGPTLPAGPPLPPGTAMMAESLTPQTAPAMVDGYAMSDEALHIDFGATATNFPETVLRWAREPDATEWDIALTPDVPVNLLVEVGRGSARVDLSGMTLTDLLIQVGVGSVDVMLDQSSGSGQIRVGVGNATLRVPDDVPVRVDIGGSSSFDLGDGFAWDGASIVNAAWQARDDPSTGLSLIVEAGAGRVNLVTLHHTGTSGTTEPAGRSTPGDTSVPASPAPPGAQSSGPPRLALTATRPIGDGTARTAVRRSTGRLGTGYGAAGRFRLLPDRKVLP